MILVAHIVIALTSIAYISYLFMRPSNRGFHTAYGLVATTIVSGTYLAVIQPSHMAHVCVSGLMYISVVLAVLVAARKKFSLQNINIDQ